MMVFSLVKQARSTADIIRRDVENAFRNVRSDVRRGMTRRQTISLLEKALAQLFPMVLLDLIGQYTEWVDPQAQITQ